MSEHHTPEEIRKGLTHPVIDGDGHWVEYAPVFAEKIRKVTGDLGANGFLQSQQRGPDSLSMTPEQRAERDVAMEGFWGRQSTNTRDRATAMMPKMLYDRLDELGIDFGIVYPTAGLGIPRIADDETRRAVIRGFNIVTADYFAKLSDRLTPAAADPLGWDDLDATDAVYVTAGDPGALAHARSAACMVVTGRILRELLATDVVPDVLVGSARDPSESVRTDLLPWRPRMIVRTEGVRGGTFETADGIAHRWEPAPVTPGGDSYGAGDSFAAGLTFALGQGRSPADAVAFAARCGAACASARGPYAGQLTAADL